MVVAVVRISLRPHSTAGTVEAAAVVAAHLAAERNRLAVLEYREKVPTAAAETLVVHLHPQIFDAAAVAVALLLPEMRQAEAVQRLTAAAVAPAPHIPSAVHL